MLRLKKLDKIRLYFRKLYILNIAALHKGDMKMAKKKANKNTVNDVDKLNVETSEEFDVKNPKRKGKSKNTEKNNLY
mgnify:CR=1 FL=1